MKSVAGILILLVLISGVAARGSQAQPLPRINPVLRHCQQTGPLALESMRCRPVAMLAAPAQLERDFAGDIGGGLANETGSNGADPDWPAVAARAALDVAWRAAIAAASVNFVQRALDWAFGDNIASTPPYLTHLDRSIFDPAQ